MAKHRKPLILKLLTFLILLQGVQSLCAQKHSLTFTSVSDTKFFVYLNGRLQNEKSSGMVTLQDLEEKEYHVRIVIDDPFEVAVTRRIKPDGKHNEYTVLFNAVRERVYLRPAKSDGNESEWIPDTTQVAPPLDTDQPKPEPRTPLRRSSHNDTITQNVINRIHHIAQ